jgi:hypothetical protein
MSITKKDTDLNISNKKRKINTSSEEAKINTFSEDIDLNKSYRDIDLNKYKVYLYERESYFANQIKNINDKKKQTNKMIAKKCKEDNGDHEWIRDRENCMYGSTFTMCKNCGVDHYDDSYLHY